MGGEVDMMSLTRLWGCYSPNIRHDQRSSPHSTRLDILLVLTVSLTVILQTAIARYYYVVRSLPTFTGRGESSLSFSELVRG